MVSPPIHKLEAPPWSDGAACVIVASEEWARRRGLDRGRADRLGRGTRQLELRRVRGRAHELSVGARVDGHWRSSRAGRRLDDLDVAEIYGAFAASELMTYEAMGLFESGRGARGGGARGDGDRRAHPDQHLGRTAVARAPAAGDAAARAPGGLRAAHAAMPASGRCEARGGRPRAGRARRDERLRRGGARGLGDAPTPIAQVRPP